MSASFHYSSPTVRFVDFSLMPVNATETPSHSNAEKHDRKYYSPSAACVTTLFHNGHAKYRNYTDSRRLSTTLTNVCPIDFRSTPVDATETPSSYNVGKPDWKYLIPSPQASQHFSISVTLNTGNTQKVGVFSP
jgi:hypothetical protein